MRESDGLADRANILLSTATVRTRRRDLATIAALATLLHLAVAVGIYRHNPNYLVDYRLNTNPDAVHYVLLGVNFWTRGAYSRQTAPPFQPDILRTPVYPILAGLVTAEGRIVWPLYMLQACCLIGTAWLVYGLAAYWGRRAALTAALCCAVDPSLLILDFQAMTEPLFIFLSTWALVVWIRHAANRGTEVGPLRPFAGIGLLFGTAILTRPAAAYFPVVAAVPLLATAIRHRSVRALSAAAILTITAGAVVAPWIVRNARTFGVARLTTADTINLVYFAGAGAYQVQHHIERVDAQREISVTYHLVPVEQTNNPWLAPEPVAQIDREQRAALPRILAASPRSLAIPTALGIAKAATAHNTGDLAAMRGERWLSPGVIALLSPNVLTQTLRMNGFVLSATFLWSMLFTGLTYCAAAYGALVAYRRADTRSLLLLMGLAGAYYVLTIGLVGIDAYMRHRSPYLPLVFVLTGVGLATLYERPGATPRAA